MKTYSGVPGQDLPAGQTAYVDQPDTHLIIRVAGDKGAER
jgi:hypothetical protein